MDPEVKKYFRKIINSFSLGLLWLLSLMTLGLYFGMAYIYQHIRWFNIVFYSFFVLTFVSLLWYFYRTWRS